MLSLIGTQEHEKTPHSLMDSNGTNMMGSVSAAESLESLM